MSIKSILVDLQPTQNTSAVLRVAVDLARRVIVVTVDLRGGEAVSVEHLVNFLERHDVKAEARGARSHSAVVGDTILSMASDFHCGLLVMGGYGHSKAREHSLGGPTCSVVENMTVPVLMSHRERRHPTADRFIRHNGSEAEPRYGAEFISMPRRFP